MSNWIDEVLESADPKTAQRIFWAGEVEFLSAAETDTTGRSVKMRLVRGPEEQAMVNPFAKATRRRRGFAGTFFEASLSLLGGPEGGAGGVARATILLNWSDGPSGPTVTLKLSDDEEGGGEHPFMFCKRPSAEGPGTRWMAVFVEMTDDGEAVNQAKADMADKLADTPIANSERHSQTYAQGVAVLMKSPQFKQYLTERCDTTAADWNDADVDNYIKGKLGIASKSELNVAGIPRKRWEALRSAYLEWSGRGQCLRS